MTDAFVLMTAMPPTNGHAALIDFAARLPVGNVFVVVCTQPTEPFSQERADSLREHFSENERVVVIHLHRWIEQDANAPGFWDMWRKIMDGYGMTKDDVIVASEAYGQKVADLFGAKFIPYDPRRELNSIKATLVRQNIGANMDKVIPEFQKHLIKTVTFFGAESVGKTTMSRDVADIVNGHLRFEYARPYLEMVGAEVTDEKMFDIFDGQEAIQKQGQSLRDKPFVIQDTDLYSTIGYWELWTGDTAPGDWYTRAEDLKSDLYVILSQNIPFEEDILRYGGDKRESEDEFWIGLCEREGLNYIVVDCGGDRKNRLVDSMNATFRLFLDDTEELRHYKRQHNG